MVQTFILKTIRGGRGINEMCEATFAAAAGVVRKHDVEVFDHPACDAEERERFITVAVTPPLEEGNAEACSSGS